MHSMNKFKNLATKIFIAYGIVMSISRGGPNGRFLSASAEPTGGCRRLIFGGREHDLAA